MLSWFIDLKLVTKSIIAHGLILLTFSIIPILVFQLLEDQRIISSEQELDGVRINLAGRQRMLIQKMSKEFLLFTMDKINKKAVQKTMIVFEETLHALTNGGKAPTGLQLKNYRKLLPMEIIKTKKKLQKVTDLWHTFKSNNMKILENPEDENALNDLINNNTIVLSEMNQAVNMMQKSADDKNSALQSQISIFYRRVIWGLIISFLIIIISFFVINLIIIKPIKHSLAMLQNISEGKGDLTNKVTIHSKDEVGFLFVYINQFISFLNHVITQIKEVTGKTKGISQDLMGGSEEAAASLEEMKHNIEGIKAKSVYLDNEIHSTNQAANKVREFISDVTRLIASQSSGVSEASASIEEMSASIQNIVKVSVEKLKIVNELEKTASYGEKGMKENVEIIKKVASSAHVIMDMIGVINNIAEQTNLLAMNAAIEAAHAGDAGKGFAVVADEIRKLAEDTSKNSHDISNSLKEVIDYIHISEESTNKTGDSFVNIVGGIKEVAIGMVEIETAMQELEKGSSNVLLSLNSLVSIASDVKNSSDEMNQRVGVITESMNNLLGISTDAKNGMEEMAFGVNELYKIAEIVSKSGTMNNDSIIELEVLVSQFKVGGKDSLPQEV